jgi:hypothetical protein
MPALNELNTSHEIMLRRTHQKGGKRVFGYFDVVQDVNDGG